MAHIFPINLKFTADQWALIVDRLEVGECIADAMTDREDDEPTPDRETIIEKARMMALKGAEVTLADELDLEIFVDAIDGSTMPAKLLDQREYGEPNEAEEATRLLKQRRPIEAKLAALGIEAIFPRA